MSRQPLKPGAQIDLVGNTDINKLSAEERLQIAISILKKESSSRSAKEIEFLKISTENIKFFKETVAALGFNSHDLLCQNMYYEFVPAGFALQYIWIGSMGTTFYIILQGKVGVIINLPKPGKNEFEKTEVAQLPTGASFGELSLMEVTLKPRAATIQCKEDSHFAVLDKKPYQAILGMAEKKKLDLQIDFLLSLDIFKDVGWSRHAMKPIVKLFSHHVFPKGHFIYKEGQTSETIMAIKTGEVKFTKQIVINPREPSEQVILDENSHVYTYQKLPMKRTVELATIGANQLFGDDESYLKLPRQSNAVVSSLEAEIWIIQKREFLKKLATFDESHRIFVLQAKTKRSWREDRVKEISQIANEKIDPDLFVGSNHNKNAAYSEVETRMKQKVYSQRQTQEKIVYERNQLQELTQSPDIPTNRPATQGKPSQQSKPHIGRTLATENSFVFYHNETNNSENKWFLNSKRKIPSSEENKSRILYTANSTFRAGTENNNSHHDLLSTTTYQAFAGSFRQFTNDTSMVTDFKAADETETSKSLLLIENPNFENQVPKGWNLNAIDDEFRVHGEEEEAEDHEGDSKTLNVGKQLGNRKSRVSNINTKQHFTDAGSMMNHTIQAKKRIQNHLQEQSFAKNTNASMYDFDEMASKSKKFKMIQMRKNQPRSHTSAEPKRPNHMIQEKKKADEYNTQVEEGNAHLVVRPRISTRDDDRSHELGNWTTLMSFLPQRVRMNAEGLKPHPPDTEHSQAIRNMTKTSQIPGLDNVSRTIILEGQKQIEAANGKSRDGDRSRGDLSQHQSHSGSRNQTSMRKRIQMLGSGVSDQNKTRILNVLPNEDRSYSVDVAHRLHDRIHTRNEFERGRLFDYNLMQKFRKKSRTSNGTHRAYVHDDREKERVLQTYEKFKNLKLQSLKSKIK